MLLHIGSVPSSATTVALSYSGLPCLGAPPASALGRLIRPAGSVAQPRSVTRPQRREPSTASIELLDQGKPVHRAGGWLPILVNCVGPPDRDPRPRCWHNATIPLDSLPDWPWYDICAHLKCTKCGSVGWVDPRPNWPEVINFNKGVG
jgi:hypothetical protein